jgi:hypothetical protein
MNLLSSIITKIQVSLFPHLEQALGPLTAKEKQLVELLEIIRVEDHVRRGAYFTGKRPKDRRPVARAFVAKSFLGVNETKALINTLKSSPNLCRICGFEHANDVPSESTFSRAFGEFAQGNLGRTVNDALLATFAAHEPLVNLCRDSTAIAVREKPLSKAEKNAIKETESDQDRRLVRQQNQPLDQMLDELPTACDWGVKKNAQGKVQAWKGYKFHTDTSADGLVLSAVLTSASVHDSQVAIPLCEMTHQRFFPYFELMDAAYDAKEIHEFVRMRFSVPVIDCNQRRGAAKTLSENEKERYKKRGAVERGYANLKDWLGGRFVMVKGAAKVFMHLMFGVLVNNAKKLVRRLQ